MLKILIADDEQIIREGLLSIIDWGDLGCEIIGAADSGKSAKKLFDKFNPDIVIADICMPDVNGIELAAYIRNKSKSTKLLFISGYSDFTFAQEALKHTVSNYILKPVDPLVLCDTITQLCIEIRSERKLVENNEQFNELMKNGKLVLSEHFIRQIIFGSITDINAIDEGIRFYELSYDNYVLALAEIDTSEDVSAPIPSNEFERQYQRFSIKNIAQDILDAYCDCYILDLDNNRFLFFLGINHSVDTVLIFDTVQKTLKVQLSGVKMSFGISNRFQELHEAPEAFSQTLAALRHKFYLGAESLITFNDVCENNESTFINYDRYIDTVNSAIEALDRDKALASVNELFYHVEECGIIDADSILEIRDFFFGFIVSIRNNLEEFGISQEIDCFGKSAYNSILNAETMDDLRTKFDSLLEAYIQIVSDSRSKHYETITDNAISFMRENYHKQISLNDVAEHLHLNPSYTSRIIKKNTNKNFVDILLQIRIDAAKRLLGETMLKTYEIAEQVGIYDSKYFSHVFKKVVHCTPTEFRESTKYSRQTE